MNKLKKIIERIGYMFSRIKNIFAPEYYSIYKEWDKQRSLARTPNELAEIDAIFARHV